MKGQLAGALPPAGVRPSDRGWGRGGWRFGIQGSFLSAPSC